MIRSLRQEEYPELLREIPDPPKQLRLKGAMPHPDLKLLAVVGTRKYTSYGREMCESLIAGLAGLPIAIVSGLALGMDGIAHRSAMRAGLPTLAIPGSGLDPKVLHPRSHLQLSEEIVESGGGLMSEYDDLMPSGVWAFPRRNRIMAGMCHAVLVIEAEKRSGSLITSRLAVEYNREVGAVPGAINSSTSEGPHLLIKLGAKLVESSEDIKELLGLERAGETRSLNFEEDLSKAEQQIIALLKTPLSKDTLVEKSRLGASLASATISLLEIKGLIKEELGEVRKTF